MFTRVNKELGDRIKAATEAIITKDEMGKMANKMGRVEVADPMVTNGVKKHNTGMFAHKKANWKVEA